MRNYLTFLAVAGMLAVTGGVRAEQSQVFGDYTVHYNAFTTDVLQPDMAKHYKITRSKNRALVNISVLQKGSSGQAVPVKAQVTGNATNLTGQLREMEFREISEENAVYYIAIMHVADKETLDFAVNVKVDKQAKPLGVKFRKQFYTE